MKHSEFSSQCDSTEYSYFTLLIYYIVHSTYTDRGPVGKSAVLCFVYSKSIDLERFCDLYYFREEKTTALRGLREGRQ